MSRIGEKISQLKGDMSDMAENHFKEATPEDEVKGPVSLPPYRPEPSPIKEALLTKFAKLAPASSSDDLLGTSPSASASERSWLRQVKGKIAKTVEEKYTEYKQEKEMKRQMAQNSGAAASSTPDSDLIDITSGGINSDPSDVCPLSHSQSVGHIDSGVESGGDLKNSHSVDFSGSELLRTSDEESKFSPVDEERFIDEPKTPTPAHEEGENTEDMLTPTPLSPSRSRKRFTFPSFQSLRSSPAKTEISSVPEPGDPDPDQSSTNATSAPIPTPSASVPPGETPSRSSLRSRMWNLMGKSPAAGTTPVGPTKVTEPNISVSMKELCNEEPFSGAEDLPSFVSEGVDDQDIEVAFEATEFKFEPSTQEELDGENVKLNEDGGVDAEIIRIQDSPEVSMLWGKDGDFKYWWVAGFPVCLLLILQILPLPNWLIGFITGILIGVPGACYVTYHFVQGAEGATATPFIDNIQHKVAKKPAIIVQEEIQRKFTWMNLWPTRKGPYDPLTYDVRRTSSVRIMLRGPWIEMRFPKRNLPLRRMHDDVEPKKIEFHEQVEVVDLSVCSVDLLPENLPSKRVWSKKYPIRIRTNTRKPVSSEELSKKMAAEDSQDPVEKDEAKPSKVVRNLSIDFVECEGHDENDDEKEKTDDEDEKLIFDDALEDELDILSKYNADEDEEGEDEGEVSPQKNGEEESPNKTFYLFARTGREKEEWYNRFLVAANFMQDWEHQNPKPGEVPDPNFETNKVKEQKFRLFMEDYLQAKNDEQAFKNHEENKQNPELMHCAREQVAFLNIYFARMWHDLHDSKAFIDFLREKITRKLMKVKIANYFENVSVTTLDLGPKLPQITSASLPWQDENGLWVNLELEYSGICQATVETKGIRLPSKDEPDREAQELARALGRQAATMDSDEEDSAEEDDDIPDSVENDPTSDLQPHVGFRARMLDSLLKSDFVAKVAESEWVKKNIKSKNITLQLQLHNVKGTLTLNFPPAPSDRLWYGFRYPPRLDIALRPCFGGQSLGKYEGTLSTVMKHLEKRLKLEFMKVLVFPNLDDEVLPFLNHIPYSFGSVSGQGSPRKESGTEQSSLGPLTPFMPSSSAVTSPDKK